MRADEARSRAFEIYALMVAIALIALVSTSHAQDAARPTQSQPLAATSAEPARHTLSDLDTMTFDCPKAALNAAAREAAKAPSQGTYQFSFFNIIHDAHHASYEVHFKSNYQGEPELKYCVSMYCQQGWDPRTSKSEVTLMTHERQRGRSAHTSTCGKHSAPDKKKP